jgi:hypothetical protein
MLTTKLIRNSLLLMLLTFNQTTPSQAQELNGISGKYDDGEFKVSVSSVKGKRYYSGKVLGCVSKTKEKVAKECHPADEVEFWVSCSKDNGASGDIGSVEIYMKGWQNTYHFNGQPNEGFMSNISLFIATDFCDQTVEGDEECDDCVTKDERPSPDKNSSIQRAELDKKRTQLPEIDKTKPPKTDFPPNAIIGFMDEARKTCRGFEPDGSEVWNFVETQLTRPNLNKPEVEYFAKDFRTRVAERGIEQACKDADEALATIRGADFEALAKANEIAEKPKFDRESYLGIGSLLRAEEVCPNVKVRGTKAWEKMIATGFDVNKYADTIQLGGQFFDSWANERGLHYACTRASETILMGSM